MIFKANMHRDACGCAAYITNDKGKQVDIVGNWGGFYTGLTKEDVMLSAQDIMEDFKNTNGKYPCIHIQISPDKRYPLTPAQVQRTIDVYLEEFGKQNRQGFAAVHRDEEGMHLHMELSRINPETGKLDPYEMWRNTHDRIRDRLEDEFGHPRTRHRNEKRKEISQKLMPLYGKPPAEFVAGVEGLGYVIARGGRGKKLWHIIDSGDVDLGPVAHKIGALLRRKVNVKGVEKERGVTDNQFTAYMSGYSKRFKKLDPALTFQKKRIEKYKAELEKVDRVQKVSEQFAGFRIKELKKQIPTIELQQEVVEIDTGKKPEPKPADYISSKQDAFAVSIEHFKQERFNEKASLFSENKMTDDELKRAERERLIREMEENLERSKGRGRGR